MAPSVSPLTIYLDSTNAKITGGIIAKIESDDTFQNSSPLTVADPAIRTGSVMAFLNPKTMTNRNSFHENIKDKT